MSKVEASWELYGTFLEVMRGGSLSAAARALGVSQPTVRNRIEALEQALDAVLFTRSQNGLVPTEVARSMLPHAEAMAATARALARSASGPTQADRGSVRLAASEIVGGEVLPAMLTRLRDAHPGIQIELVLSNANEDLLRRDADVAIRMVAPTQAALVAKRVGDVEIGLYASDAYLADHPAPRSVEDLGEHALVGGDRDRGVTQLLAAFGLSTSPRDFALRTDDHLAQLAAVRAGLGVGVCQGPLAERPPKLTRVLSEVKFPLPVWVVMHEDLRAVRRVRTVFDHLVVELDAYLGARPRRRRRPR
ncbi:MAG: LysR family transcriptional regulator [Sandaracinaceae bacterium]|nr:LysR family transcriptional regulator [Sandaracinaceae bacterium]